MTATYEWKMVERKRGDNMISHGEILVKKTPRRSKVKKKPIARKRK